MGTRWKKYLTNGTRFTKVEILLRDAIIICMLCLLGEMNVNPFWMGAMMSAMTVLVGCDLVKGV